MDFPIDGVTNLSLTLADMQIFTQNFSGMCCWNFLIALKFPILRIIFLADKTVFDIK